MDDRRTRWCSGQSPTSSGAAMGAPWEVRDGMAKGPGTLAVVHGADQTGSPAHLDLDFVLLVHQEEN
ncbi:hypothetical protein [Nonomuraea sp. NPDC049504]|uniref:hypothetical protein n=1 Tax=Nonomuraea sp. NPDC049504 TaxID=3154729 RepID=UPI00342B5A57